MIKIKRILKSDQGERQIYSTVNEYLLSQLGGHRLLFYNNDKRHSAFENISA